MFTYKVVKEEMWHPETGKYNSFGIRVYGAGKEIEIMTIKDIFTDRSEADRFVSLLNINKVSIIHIWDVIEDYLSA